MTLPTPSEHPAADVVIYDAEGYAPLRDFLKKNGALEYFECVGDDLKIKKGMPQKGFARLAGLKPGEIVVFSWIVYKSRAHRDEVNKKVMNDPSMKDFDPSTMPVDMKRFASGGFKPIVEA